MLRLESSQEESPLRLHECFRCGWPIEYAITGISPNGPVFSCLTCVFVSVCIEDIKHGIVPWYLKKENVLDKLKLIEPDFYEEKKELLNYFINNWEEFFGE